MMAKTPRYRYDFAWSAGDLVVLIVLCAAAFALLARKGHSSALGADAARVRAAEERINPNTASAGSMRRFPMIGPARAAAIVEYRRRHGPAPFRTPQDLMKVRGIGPRTVELVAPLLEPTGGDLP